MNEFEQMFLLLFFFTKIGWENWNAIETLKENGRNIFQTTVAYIYHLGKSTKFNQKLKNKTYSFQRKNRNTKLNSFSFTANTIEYSYSAIIGFSNIYTPHLSISGMDRVFMSARFTQATYSRDGATNLQPSCFLKKFIGASKPSILLTIRT